MSLGSGLSSAEFLSPITFSWEADWYQMKICFRFLREVDLMHLDIESNTYVLGQSVIGQGGIGHGEDDDILEFLIDLNKLNKTPLPYGQIMFFSYAGEGEFLIESATDKWLPSKAIAAFKSFGYSDVKITETFIKVSKKDTFKLKLKFGY